MEYGALIFVGSILFLYGMYFGRWLSEREIRVKRDSLERGRVLISFPADERESSSFLNKLAVIMRSVEEGD